MTWTQSGQSLCSSTCVWAETGYNVTWQTAGRKECCCSTVMMEESAGDSSLRCTSPTSPSHGKERKGIEERGREGSREVLQYSNDGGISWGLNAETSQSSPSHGEEEGLVPLKCSSFDATMLLRAIGGLGHAD